MTVKSAVGFESFMDAASEGWSLLAVQCPIEELAQALRHRSDVLGYESNVGASPLQGHPIIYVEPQCRRGCVLQLRGSAWSVLLRTVDWIEPKDAVAIRRLAAELSRETHLTTMTSVGVYSGAECRVFLDGDEVVRVDTDDPQQDLIEFCDHHEFGIPSCFIGFNGQSTTLYLQEDALGLVRRVDRVDLSAS